MLEVKIDRRELLGLHEQVAAELRRAIAEGEARPGERLPPARDLAAVLGVNRNTVLRALACCATRGCSSSGVAAESRWPGRASAGRSWPEREISSRSLVATAIGARS